MGLSFALTKFREVFTTYVRRPESVNRIECLLQARRHDHNTVDRGYKVFERWAHIRNSCEVYDIERTQWVEVNCGIASLKRQCIDPKKYNEFKLKNLLLCIFPRRREKTLFSCPSPFPSTIYAAHKVTKLLIVLFIDSAVRFFVIWARTQETTRCTTCGAHWVFPSLDTHNTRWDQERVPLTWARSVQEYVMETSFSVRSFCYSRHRASPKSDMA